MAECLSILPEVPDLNCLICSKQFYITPYQERRGGRKTCSKRCCNELKRDFAAKQPKTKPDCHPKRKHKANGFCASCYRRELLAGYDEEHLQAARERIRLQGRISNLAKAIKRPYKDVEAEVMLLLSQQDSCEICGSRKRLCIDHDHRTGQIRGMLCGNHNFLLGFARDNEETLHNCIRYLMSKEVECGD